MSKRSEYHQARNKTPVKYVWDYLVENGPATMSRYGLPVEQGVVG